MQKTINKNKVHDISTSLVDIKKNNNKDSTWKGRIFWMTRKTTNKYRHDN